MSDPSGADALLAREPVLAAGALCWRRDGDAVRVLLVHRETHGDVSLAKGEVEPGESLPETAVREAREETGLDLALGAPLGTTSYTLENGREKRVNYWAAHVETAPAATRDDDEVSRLEWRSLAEARGAVTYDDDVELLDRFAALLDEGIARTFAVIALRHASALPLGAWDGPDATRPLLHRGHEQARAIARGIAAFGLRRILSSTATRCLQTVAPLPELTRLDVHESDTVSQDAHEAGTASLAPRVASLLEQRETTLVCSHGPVIPALLAELAAQTHHDFTRELRDASGLSTAEFTVVHLSAETPSPRIVAVETHGPAAR